MKQNSGPGIVLMIAAEDDIASVVNPSVLAEGGDLDRLKHVYFQSTDKKTGRKNKVHVSSEHIAELAVKVRESEGVKMIVIDPIVSLVSRGRLNDNSQAELRSVLDPLQAMAQAADLAIIGIVHLNKNKESDTVVNRICGSTAYANTSRCTYLLGHHPDDENKRLLKIIKVNLPGLLKSAACYSLDPLSGVEREELRSVEHFAELNRSDFDKVVEHLGKTTWHPPVDVDAQTIVGAPAAPKGKTTRIAACGKWLLDFMGYWRWTDAELKSAGEKEGFTPDNVSKAMTILRRENLLHSKILSFGGSWVSWIGEKGKVPPPKPEVDAAKCHETAGVSDTPEAPETPETVSAFQPQESHESSKCHESHECQGVGLIGVPDHHPPKRKRKRKDAP